MANTIGRVLSGFAPRLGKRISFIQTSAVFETSEVWTGSKRILMNIIQVAIGLIIAFLILREPYLGVVFIAASLPIIDLLPRISIATSVVPLIGGMTIIGFLINKRKETTTRSGGLINVHFLGLLFIAWIYLSNPEAAWLGRDRNWIFTYFQLWVSLWLVGELLDTPNKHHVLMWVFSFVAIISAAVAIQSGSIGEDINTSTRAIGLAQGANTAARYFVIALVFLNYLRSTVSKPLHRFLTISGMAITFLGTIYTVSRTGIVLLAVVMMLIILLRSGSRYRIQLFGLMIIAIFVIWFGYDPVIEIFKKMAPAIAQGTDTIGLRYKLWQAGWQMWLDHPIRGVGIGMYPAELIKYAYGIIPQYYLTLTAHSTYIQLLAETGIIGLGLFLLMLFSALGNILRAGNTNDASLTSLRNVWLIVFIVFMIGGITKTDQADKLLWVGIGASVYFRNRLIAKTQPATMYTTPERIQV